LPPPGFFPVLIASVVLGLVSFFFYFRMVRALWLSSAPADSRQEPLAGDFNAAFVCGFCALAVVVLGVLMRLPGLS
jgi:NADH:ubiquinone oxidoreductase subunit 2 (subunit N)